MGTKEARELFREMGIPIKADGMISKNLSREDIDKLKVWYKATQASGIQMPTEESFYENVLLAISLFPQVENRNINYMFGKGIGIEIALRGNVVSRDKNNIEFPYRTHSDFEMYGMDGNYDPDFKEVFGAQERFPETQTKGLSQLPEGFMASTAEEVDLDGIKVLVPQLELLFLDKYLMQESTPRKEGVDAALLAKQYNLDYSLIYKYLLEYSIKPKIAGRLNKEIPTKETVTRQVNRFLNECADELWEENDCYPSKIELCEHINEKIKSYNPKTIRYGISMGAYEEILPENLLEMGESRYGVLTSYATTIINNIAKGQAEELIDIRQAFKKLNDFCIENGLKSLPKEKIQQMESLIEQYIVSEMGRDSKELKDKSFEQITLEYFQEENTQEKATIEH